MEPTWPKILMTRHERMSDPVGERFARSVRYLEAHRCVYFALQDRCALLDRSGGVDVSHLQADEIAASELAIDGHVEQGKVTGGSGQLKPDTNSPDVLGKQRSFLTDDAAMVPSFLGRDDHGQV